jgi:glycosyltransferase involved in cell wall biosynthesis
MLNYEFPPLGGGASPVSYEIAKSYVKLDHKVDVVTMHYKDLPYFEKKDGINIYRVKCLRGKKEICHPWEQLTYIWSAKKFLKNHLKNHAYDINHTHFIIPTGIISLWLKKKYHLPYIITSHGSDVPGYNPDRFKFLHKFTGPILKEICKNAKSVTTPSNYLKDLIKNKIDFNLKKKIVVLPNGARNFYIPRIKKENIIFSSGRLFERKGFQFLIMAFNKLYLKNWKLYILGDGPYKEKLVKLAKNNKNIIFTGWIDNKNKKYIDVVNKAKIFSLLSQSESQGIVYLEAMSTGCAIIASNITACKETITLDIGYLVERENVEEITKKIKTLIENEEKLRKFMKNSRKRYKKMYTYENIIKKYEQLLFK